MSPPFLKIAFYGIILLKKSFHSVKLFFPFFCYYQKSEGTTVTKNLRILSKLEQIKRGQQTYSNQITFYSLFNHCISTTVTKAPYLRKLSKLLKKLKNAECLSSRSLIFQFNSAGYKKTAVLNAFIIGTSLSNSAASYHDGQVVFSAVLQAMGKKG